MLLTIIGHSSIHEGPSGNIVAEAVSLRYCHRQQHEDGEETFIGRIKYHLQMLTCNIEDDCDRGGDCQQQQGSLMLLW